ncbi:hypothetical protein F5Y05DRAFT_364157 [Hypoxylon sp. FL0543]|nr:hypothetical protein F5Y05DRAFT_364157 [Hypoxylon sp. FL0543]
MEVVGAGNAVPSYCMLDLMVFEKCITYVFMYNLKQFYVHISEDRLKGRGDLLSNFKRLKDGIDDVEIMHEFENWVLGALNNFMSEVAPTPAPGSRKSLTLLEYFSAPAFAMFFINQTGKLRPVREEYHPEHHGRMGPRTQIVDSLPDPEDRSPNPPSHGFDHATHSMGIEGRVLRSDLPNVPLISASELERVDDELSDKELSDVPKKVRRVGTGEIYFFKAGLKDHGHLREMGILSEINRDGRFQPPFLTSRLVGLVVWGDDDPSLMGVLLDYIEGDTLSRRMGDASAAQKTKWFYQVEATMRQLHDVGIVWGEAQADNVIINPAGDAVVIDFGGGYIGPEARRTFQKDFSTLEKMAADLGVTYNPPSPSSPLDKPKVSKR